MRENFGIFWLNEKEREDLERSGEIILVGCELIRARDFFFTFRQCTGIDNMFDRAAKEAKRLGCDVIFNPSGTNVWGLGVGARGFFEFFRFNKNSPTPYRGYHGI